MLFYPLHQPTDPHPTHCKILGPDGLGDMSPSTGELPGQRWGRRASPCSPHPRDPHKLQQAHRGQEPAAAQTLLWFFWAERLPCPAGLSVPWGCFQVGGAGICPAGLPVPLSCPACSPAAPSPAEGVFTAHGGNLSPFTPTVRGRFMITLPHWAAVKMRGDSAGNTGFGRQQVLCHRSNDCCYS